MPSSACFAAERRHVAVRRPGERGQHLDAAADQPPAELRGAAAEQRPGALEVERHLADPGVGLVVVPALPVAARAGLRERRRRGRDLGPVQRAGRGPERRVHQVAAVQGRPAGQQGERQHHRAEVAEPDHPGRVGRSQRVPVDDVEQVDRELAAPRRRDRADPRIAQHGGQLRGALLLGGGGDAAAVHALPEHHVVAAVTEAGDAGIDPRPEVVGHAAGRRGHADGVAGTQRGREAHAFRLTARRARREPFPGRVRPRRTTSTAARGRAAGRRGRGSRGSRRAATAPR